MVLKIVGVLKKASRLFVVVSFIFFLKGMFWAIVFNFIILFICIFCNVDLFERVSVGGSVISFLILISIL